MPSTQSLRLVSITGADDLTDIEDLQRLGSEFPFVEWALLYVPHPGGPRNPTQAWRERFFDAKVPGTSAVHLCFREPFEQLLKGQLPADVLRADRIQLNINARGVDFSDAEVLQVFRHALKLGPDIILQYQPATAAAVSQFLESLEASEATKVHVLLDESRGTGVLPAVWAVPPAVQQAYCGFAGGLGPTNVSEVLEQLEAMGRGYWIDMESGVRTNNQFDLAKVEAVLRAAAAHRLRESA